MILVHYSVHPKFSETVLLGEVVKLITHKTDQSQAAPISDGILTWDPREVFII